MACNTCSSRADTPDFSAARRKLSRGAQQGGAQRFASRPIQGFIVRSRHEI